MVDDDEANIFKRRVKNKIESTKGEDHVSYGYNLHKAKEFIEKTMGKLPKGMEVKICDSDGLKQSLITFSCNHSKSGRWANPVFLHQDGETFRQELYAAAMFYKKMAESDPVNAPSYGLNGLRIDYNG